MAFDIAKFDTRTRSESGAAMQVRHPSTGAPFLDPDSHQPLTITLLGRNSDTFRRVQREITQRDADRAAASVVKTDEDFERERFDILVACTVGWSFDQLEGQPFPHGPDTVRKLWGDNRWPWLRTQAMNFVLAEGNFLAS